MKRLKYTRRFVNVQLTGGKRKVCTEGHTVTITGWIGLGRICAACHLRPPHQGFRSQNPTDEPQPRCGLNAPLYLEWNNLGPDRRIETTGLADTAHRGTKDGFHIIGKWEGRVIPEHGIADGFLGVRHYAIYAHVSAAALGRRVPLQSGARGRLVLSLCERLENLIDLCGPKRLASVLM